MLKFFCTLLTLTLLSTLNVNAQVLTRKEKKAIKKEIKSYKKDPVKWVNMKDRHEDEVENLKATIEMLKAKLEAETKEKQELAEKLAALFAGLLGFCSSLFIIFINSSNLFLSIS